MVGNDYSWAYTPGTSIMTLTRKCWEKSKDEMHDEVDLALFKMAVVVFEIVPSVENNDK